MRHVIAHLIRGEAEKAHINITRELTDTFDTFPIHNRIQPHLTLKRWFELDDTGMEILYKTLDDFVSSHNQCDYSLKGFGHFATDVIYVDVIPSQEMISSIRELKMELHKIKDLTFDEFDLIENDLHATVVMRSLKDFDYDQVWNHLNQGPAPDFQMKFDNVAVLNRETDKWVVDRIWELKP